MLGLTNPIFAMRVAAFFNKEREIHFERSALSLATVGDGVTGELPNNASDSYACPDLNATINCRQFSTQEVSEFLFSLLTYLSAEENADCVVRRNRTRVVASALSTVVLHFPFSHEPVASEHTSLFAHIFRTVLQNWFSPEELVTARKNWLPLMINGVLGRVLIACPILFESHISSIQNLLEDTVSKTISDDSNKLTPPQILDRWRTTWSLIDSLLNCVPTMIHQNQRDCFLNLIKVTRDLLIRKISNIQWMLLDVFQTSPLGMDDFNAVCDLLLLWNQLSQAINTISKHHVTVLSGAAGSGIAVASSAESTSVTEEESLTETQDPTTHVTSAYPADHDWSCCMTGWSALQTVTKDFSHEKLKGVLKNRLCSPVEVDHTENHLQVDDSDFNLLHELHRPTNFHSALARALLATLEHSMTRVRLVTDPTAVSLTLFDTPSHLIHKSDNDSDSGTQLCILLQPPVFCSSAHGPLFNGTSPVSLVEEASALTSSETPTSTSAPGASLLTPDSPFGSGFTVQSTISAWMGASGTGAGLPHPNLVISSSVRDFVSLTLSHLVPAVLAFLEADKRNWHVYTTVSNTESDHDEVCGWETQPRASLSTIIDVPNTPPPQPPLDVSASGTTSHAYATRKQISETSSSFDDDTFFSIVSPLLNALVQFLGGQPVQLRTQSIPEQFGILAQITELLIITDEPQLTDFEKITHCIADCLVLRSLCHALGSLFHSRYKLSAAAVIEPSQLSTNTDISSQFTEFAKQYDSVIRLLSEHMVDLSIIYCNTLVVDVPDPDPTKCPDKWLGLECSRNVRALNAFLRFLWHSMGQTCPAGLARQLLAHVGAQCLGVFVQLFSTEEYTAQTDSAVAKNDAWITLRTAEFCLFASSEHVTDVFGLSQRSEDIKLIHATASLLAQLLLCRHMPDPCWSKLHNGGFYKQILTEEKSFDFSPANWLYLSNGSLFSDLPFVRMRDERQQTELEVEWELFAASRHFDPIRLLSLISSWEARLSTAILTRDAFVSPTDPDEVGSVVRVMASLFRVCALVPGLEVFHTSVISAYQSADSLWSSLPKLGTTSFSRADWPIWLRAILLVLDDPLNRIWLLFKQLVDWHTNEDDALSVDFLKGTENPIDCLAQHQSRTPAFWVHLVHGNRLPCGCDLPKPAPLRPQSPLRCFFSNETLVTSNEDRTNTSSVLSARKKAAFDRWHEELHRSNYTWYFLHSGYQTLAWRAFACEIIQLGVMDVPVGIQLALATLDETILMAPQETSPEFRDGQLMWLYMVLLSLSERVATEFTDSSVSRVQHSVLLEYLVSLLESTQEEEVVKCKKRLQTHLENIKASQWSYPESVGHSSSGRAFRLSQLVRQVQKGALSDLYYLQSFFRCNVAWIRGVVRGLRTPSSVADSAIQPFFGFVETDQSKYCADCEPVVETDTIRHLDWERIGQINFGLTESVIHALRSSATKAATRPNPGSSGTAEASAQNVAL